MNYRQTETAARMTPRQLYKRTVEDLRTHGPGYVFRQVAREAKMYCVDTAPAVTFHNFFMTLIETGAEMEPPEILGSRAKAIMAHLTCGRPYSIFRRYWAERVLKTTPTSSKEKKFFTEATAALIFQMPIYYAILRITGVSPEEMRIAYPFGLFYGAISSRPYGWYLDKWKKLCGEKSVLDKSTHIEAK